MNPFGPKKRLFALFNRIPVIRETADPVVAGLLVALVLLTLIALATPHTAFPNDRDARSHIIQVAGGLLLVLGAYFTPVSIRQLRVQQYADRLGKIIDQLGSDDDIVKIGAVRLLHAYALEEPAFPADATTQAAILARSRAISDVLTLLSSDAAPRIASVAEEVLVDLRLRGLAPAAG